jgi:hypothetical protein
MAAPPRMALRAEAAPKRPAAPPSAGASRQTPFRTVFLIWLGWAVLMMAFQAWSLSRYDLDRPDTVFDWTQSWTSDDSAARHPYLQNPVLTGHTAWDSEFYVSIALHGYEDPGMRAASPNSTADQEIAAPKKTHPTWVSLNHAFLPGYPYAMALIARPLAAAGMNDVGAATIAGVAISLAGALAAMLAIADLSQGDAAEQTRAGFYLAVWPAAVFLAQVYTEGMFMGLSFGALAMLRRDRWVWAASLAAAAVWTRATGFLLVIPFAWAWWFGGRRTLPRALLALSPIAAYLVWRLIFGADFDFVETRYFGRWPLALGQSWDAWHDFVDALISGDPPTKAYDWVELAGIAAWLATSALYWRRDKALTLYGLATFAIVVTSGAALGMHRYAMAVPALFLAPAQLGRWPSFDRLWTLACALGLAALTALFSFGFWAG